jgi:hypothetical protein
MADIARIKRNVGKMVEQDAPESDIDQYIAQEGVSVEEIRSFNPNAPKAGFLDQAKDYAKETARGLGLGAIQGYTLGGADELTAAIKHPGLGGGFDQKLSQEQARYSSASEDAPIAYTVGEIGGAVTGLLSGGALASKVAPRAIQKVGEVVGKNQATRIAGSVATGGISGGVYGYNAANGTPEERRAGAEVGAGLGAIGGPVGIGVAAGIQRLGPLTQRAKNLFSRPKTNVAPADLNALPSSPPVPMGITTDEAASSYNQVRAALQKDFPDNWENVLAAYKNSDLSLADIAATPSQPAGLRTLMKGTAQYAPGQKSAEEFFEPKIAERNTRITTAAKSQIADLGNFTQTIDGIVSKGREKAKPLYDKAYQGTVTDTSILMTPEIQAAIQKSYKDYPTELATAAPNSIKVLDYAKKVLDDEIETAQRQGQGNFARSRVAVKNELVKAMDDASPDYAKARETAGDYLSLKSAMEEGANFAKTDPEQVGKFFTTLPASEKEAYKLGVVKSLRDQVDRLNPNANPYNHIFGKDGQQKRLAKILTPKEFESFKAEMLAEDRLFKLRNEVLGGSPTASKQIAASQIADATAGIADALMTGGVRGAALSALRGAVKKSFDGLNDRKAQMIAEILYETDPKKKLLVIDRIMPKGGLLTKSDINEVKQIALEIDRALVRRNYAPAGAAAPIAAPDPEQPLITVRPSDARRPQVDLPTLGE